MHQPSADPGLSIYCRCQVHDASRPALDDALPGREGSGMSTEHKPLAIGGPEAVHDTLAQAIDNAGKTRARLLRVKRALLNAQATGGSALLARHVESALQGL